jgi:membrane protein YqaA with SNARE-associated domain
LRRGFYPRAVLFFGVLSVALGIALVAETASVGGGSVGYLLGVLFVGLGAARLYILRRR